MGTTGEEGHFNEWLVGKENGRNNKEKKPKKRVCVVRVYECIFVCLLKPKLGTPNA